MSHELRIATDEGVLIPYCVCGGWVERATKTLSIPGLFVNHLADVLEVLADVIDVEAYGGTDAE